MTGVSLHSRQLQQPGLATERRGLLGGAAILDSIRTWWRTRRGHAPDAIISTSSEFARLNHPGGRSESLRWSEVTRVIAYKYDLVTTDLVCLDFHSPAADLLVHEEMPGWDKLVSELTRHLPGATPYEEWWPLVLQAAFSRSEQVVFEAPGSAR